MCIRDSIKTQEKEELVAVDFLGPFPIAIHGGTKHILVCIEAVSYTHLDVYKRQL